MSDIKSQPPSFAELGVAAEICDGLATRGITRTFAIQELTLPIALSGQDLIGQARTGMGKTYGFGVPLLDRVFDDADIDELDGTPRALVVVPTRELAQQVTEDLQVAAAHLPVRLASIYGGRPYEEQIKKLNKGVDVIIGTPGRLIDLHERGELQLDRVAILVLDEADEMLDLVFSATMPGAILTLARRFMEKPIHIRAESGEQDFTHSSTRKVTFQAHRMDKVAVVAHALQASGRGRTIIFARTKRAAAQLADDLARRGFHVGAVHGDLGQKSREKSLHAFRTGQVDILVATDIAARGIDVDDVTHVINYQVPDDPMTFVHRIGRTGRAGQTGTAITMVGYDELGKWQVINDELDLGEPNPPQWFSTSPELAQALDIPADVEETVGPETKVVGQVPVREKSPTRTTARRGSSRRRRGGRR